MACKLSELADRSDPSYLEDKRAASQDEFVLERVQGLTSTTLHSLASNPVTGWVAFPAACVLVLLDPKTNEQKFIESPSLRNISCCTFTDDGRFVAFGETGMKPHIAMWNLREHKECHKFVTDTTVRAIFLHPTSPIIISLGQKESIIVVWDYVKGMRMASCKWTTMPLSLTIPRTGSCLVVCGHRKITLFNISKVDSKSYETNVFEDRKTVLLGKQSEYTFVDVESGRGKHERTVYTVTSCGYLCEVKLGDILIDKAIKVDTQTFCVRYNTELLFVGCPAGVVKICDPDNLTVTAAVSLSSLLGPSAMPKVGSKGYLDVCTLVVDENEKIVTCVYADCSMHSWQIGTDGQKIVCSAIEPGVGTNGIGGHPASKSNLLRAFIGCCEKAKGGADFLTKFSMTEHNKPPIQYGGRRLVNENRASYQNVNAVRFTPDGKDVICGNEEGEIKVYELSTGILRRVIEAHSSQVTCIELAYDDDFQLVCSGGRDRVMFVLNARTDFSLVQVLCDHSAAITAISLVNHKGVLTLVSAAADNVILIRRAILGGTLRFTITGEIAQTNCNRSFFVTSDYIALGGKDSQIKVFKADPVFVSKPVKTINCQKLSPTNAGFKAIDIDPSSSFMAVSQANGNISVYHLQTGQPVASLPLQSDITNIQFTGDLKYMVSSTSNGCDLVWRLPERMTELMRAKQEKTFQIETNKEVTYETYMSCVKVCKEEEDDDEESTDHDNHQPRHQERLPVPRQRRTSSGSRQRSPQNQTNRMKGEGIPRDHITQNSSNHNSEWERTPSIDSMSILEDYTSSPLLHRSKAGERYRESKCRGLEGGRKSCNTCCSESALSCSTCTQSVSTTTHTSCCSAAASDSTTSTEDGHTGPGEGQHLRFYCGADHELFGQVIDGGNCIKVGKFREEFNTAKLYAAEDVYKKGSKDKGVDNNMVEANNSKQTTSHGTKSSLNDMNPPLTKGLRENGAGIEKHPAKCTKAEKIRATSLNRTCKDTDKPVKQRGGSHSDENLVLMGGDEHEKSLRSTQHQQQQHSDLSLQLPRDVSQNSDISHFIRPPVHETRFPRSKKILEKTIFYEEIMRGSLKSSRHATLSSPTRQHTTAVKEAVQSFSQRSNSVPGGDTFTKSKTANRTECERTSVGAEDVFEHWTPLTTPEYSNTSSNITNLVPSFSSTVVDLCNSSKPTQEHVIGVPVRAETSQERIARDRRCSPTPIPSAVHTLNADVLENPPGNVRVNKLGSDTTQEESESFRTDCGEDMMVSAAHDIDTAGEHVESCDFNTCTESIQSTSATEDVDKTSVPIASSAEVSTRTVENSGEKFDASNKEVTLSTEDPTIKNNTRETSETADTTVSLEKSECGSDGKHDKVEDGPLRDAASQENSQPEENSAEKEQSMLAQLQQEGFTVPEKYHSALRSCMQLSNSQETFATLRVDTNDLELMAFLSHALKKKLVAAGLVGLSYNEIDSLLNSGVLSSETSRNSETEATAATSVVKTVSTATDDVSGNTEVSTPKEEEEATKALTEQPEAIHNLNNSTKTSKTYQVKDKIEEIRSQGLETGEASRPGSPSCRLRSPVGDMKRRMYKSILYRLSRARRSPTDKSSNRHNLESESDQSFESEMRQLLQTTARGGEAKDLTHSDTYLKLDSSKESQPEQNPESCSETSTDASNALDSLQDKAVSPSKRKGLSDDCRDNWASSKNGGASGGCSVGVCVRENRERLKRTGDVQAVHGSTPGEAATCCRGQRVSEELGERPDLPQSHTARMLSVESTHGKASEESVHSKTDSFVSTISKDMSAAEHCSESDSGVDAESHREKPIAEMFRDQDEYLRKLKEVRENFERSIQALSAERKSRQAAEERGRSLPRM